MSDSDNVVNLSQVRKNKAEKARVDGNVTPPTYSQKANEKEKTDGEHNDQLQEITAEEFEKVAEANRQTIARGAFEEVMSSNRETATRLARERSEANVRITRSWNLVKPGNNKRKSVRKLSDK